MDYRFEDWRECALHLADEIRSKERNTVFRDSSTLEGIEQLDCFIKGIIALDRETGARLKVSDGRRRAGKPRKYFVTAPDGTFYTGYFQRSRSPENPTGAEQVEMHSTIFTFAAWTDQEAIEKANRLFPAKYAAFKQRSYNVQPQQTPVADQDGGPRGSARLPAGAVAARLVP